MTNSAFNEIDCECTNDLYCPYCGYKFSDSWEIGDSDGEEKECGKCEKLFIYSTEISRTFSSQVADCLNGGNHDFSITCWDMIGTHKKCRICGKKENES